MDNTFNIPSSREFGFASLRCVHKKKENKRISLNLNELRLHRLLLCQILSNLIGLKFLLKKKEKEEEDRFKIVINNFFPFLDN